MPTNLKIINQTDVKNLVDNELRKKDKLISKEEIRILIKNEIMKQNKFVYNELTRQRRRIGELEDRNKKLKLNTRNEL